jgi:aspartyl protease
MLLEGGLLMVTKIRIISGLPFTSAKLEANGQILKFERVLIDSGSGTCLFKTDDLAKIGIFIISTDKLEYMRGIGGEEVVISKLVSSLSVGNMTVNPFTIQIGALDYGMQIDGILGVDFLLKTGAKIDFENLMISA